MQLVSLLEAKDWITGHKHAPTVIGKDFNSPCRTRNESVSGLCMVQGMGESTDGK
jgi:hypothetical protein